ncbi:MAG: hypothetical protein HQL72_13860 [Magnetococcales bacterium]|nr:hypothetical protein [Magnetococcales bacterium]
MFILRILLFAGLFYLIFRLVRSYFSGLATANTPAEEEGPTLVCCASCQTWIPPESAIIRGDKPFCSDKCLPS